MRDPESRHLPFWAAPAAAVAGLRLDHAVRTLSGAAALETLILNGGGSPLDRALQGYQRAHPKLGRNDRLVLGTAVYHLARNRELLAGAGDGLPASPGLLLLALAEACGGAESLGGMRHLPGGVQPWRRALAEVARRRHDLTTRLLGAERLALADADPALLEALTTLFSVPEWWLRRGPWSTVGEVLAELFVLRQPQNLTLRVQMHRGLERRQVAADLAAAGVPTRPTERSPWGLVVEGRHNVLATELYRSGTVEVQDEGSQLVACVCDPKPNERVLDFCAGGGGKALALAAALGGRGHVVAHDISAAKLSDARRRARRGGLANLRCVADLAQVKALGPYHLVLVDVPCTSSGTLRRNPDVAWRWSEAELPRLLALQTEIVECAASLVAPGGHLVYATCSVLPAENREQLAGFLARNPAFALAAPGERSGHGPLLDIPGAEQGAFRLPATLPRYSGDGFFVGRLRRRD